MRYKEILKSVASDLDLPIEEVEEVYNSYWGFIKNTIQELPLKNDLSEKNFNTLNTNFNIPCIGKLYTTWDTYSKLKEKYNRHHD